jgi:ribose-phosphate pyrophosphokinase
MAIVKIHAFPDGEHLARRVARDARTDFALMAVHRFPDGESLVRVSRPVGRQAVVVRSLDDPNAKIIEVLLAADALRRAGARSVVLVCPYLPYMRQDKVFRAGEPVSQRVIAGLLGASFDRVITLEAHLHRTRRLADVFRCPAESLSAAPAIAEWIQDGNRAGCVVVGPDRESAGLVTEVANLAGLTSMVGVKRRLADRSVRISFRRGVKAAGAIVVDDIASSGATLTAVVRSLRGMRIRSVDVVVAHALFEPGALTRIRAAGARRIISCDTIAHSTNGIEIAPLLAKALTGVVQ